MKPIYTILVNSSDGFDDCWPPFFGLMAKYWPTRAPIVLNTEQKQWSFDGLDIRCAQVLSDTDTTRPTWSECLMRCLDQIESPLVLYLQEDYFLEQAVRADVIDALAARMVERSEIKHIGLTPFGAVGPFEPWQDDDLWTISRRSRYRISTQAALWRVPTLRSYLRADENGWMFEIFGSRRARRTPDMFLTVNRDTFGPPADQIIRYTPTGIIKGRWHPGVPALFRRHGINVDFARRGFVKEVPAIARRLRTARELIARPRTLLSGLLGT